MKDLVKAIRLRMNMNQEQLYELCHSHSLDLAEFIVSGNERKDGDIIFYHASRKGITGNIKPISRSRCDFGQGFYMGTEAIQPLT